MQELSDAQWERIAPLMPQVRGRSRPFRDHRQVVEGIVFRYRCGVAWRDVPERFGLWQTRRIPANDATPEVSGVWQWLVAGSLDDLRRQRSVSSSRG